MKLQTETNTKDTTFESNDNFIFEEYENLYISNNKKSIPSSYFDGLARKQQNELAISIVRFAIEKYLRWTPREVKNYLTPEIIQKLKLSTLVKSYIDFPPEYSKDGLDIIYLAYLMYPKKFHLSMEEQCINMFHRIIKGDIKKYPSTWIDDVNGIRRLSIIIRYVIKQLPRFKSPEELYEFFASPKGSKVAEEYKIRQFILSLYGNTLDAVHHALPTNAKSDFLYNVQVLKRDCRGKIKLNK